MASIKPSGVQWAKRDRPTIHAFQLCSQQRIDWLGSEVQGCPPLCRAFFYQGLRDECLDGFSSENLSPYFIRNEAPDLVFGSFADGIQPKNDLIQL